MGDLDITNRDRVLATDGSKIASETIPFARQVRAVASTPAKVELAMVAAPHRVTGPALYLQETATQNEAEQYETGDPVLIGIAGPLPAVLLNGTGNPLDVDPDMYLLLDDDGYVKLESTPLTRTDNSVYKVVKGKAAIPDTEEAFLEVVPV